MNSKQEVKRLLKESGNSRLFSEDVYPVIVTLTKMAGKRDPMLKQLWESAEGFKEQYMHDLFIKNKEVIESY